MFLENQHVIDQLPAYALGVLEADESQQVAAHLVQCDSCREELSAYRQVVDDLALSAPFRQPPARVKSRLMKRINQPAPSGERMGFLQRASLAFRQIAPAWGIVSLVLILALATSNLFFVQQLRQSQPSLRSIKLLGTDAAPKASGMLVISQNGEYGTLVVDGLPNLGETQQYQLWLIKDGKRTSGGVFSVDSSGYGSLVVSSPKPLITFQAFGVTIEPPGGSPGPTGSKVLGGEF